jgi:hypothetical protein
MSTLRLSEKHGVNPALDLCYFCGEAKGVVMFGRMKGDAPAPHGVVLDKQPCDECAAHMKAGVILIEVKEGEEGENPHRLGGFAVLKDDAINRIVQPPELAAQILKQRVAFVPHDAWVMLGLPTKAEAAA